VATLPHAWPSWALFCEAEGLDPDVDATPDA
jgi:hypothetical protein